MSTFSNYVGANIQNVYGQNNVNTNVNVLTITSAQADKLNNKQTVTINGVDYNLSNNMINLITVGAKGISNSDTGGNTGTWYLQDEKGHDNTQGNTAAHEFSHLLGLQDRYQFVQRALSGGEVKPEYSFVYMPAYQANENSKDYNPQNNLMANAASSKLSPNQIAIIFSIKKGEVEDIKRYVFYTNQSGSFVKSMANTTFGIEDKNNNVTGESKSWLGAVSFNSDRGSLQAYQGAYAKMALDMGKALKAFDFKGIMLFKGTPISNNFAEKLSNQIHSGNFNKWDNTRPNLLNPILRP